MISSAYSSDATFQHEGVRHRRAVLCFLANLDVDELHLFFSLLLNPLLLNPLATDTINTRFHTPCEKAAEPYSSVLVQCSNFMALGNLSWKKKYGFLHVAEDIMRTFDESHIRPFLNPLMRVVVHVLESCMSSLNSDLWVNDTDTLMPSAKTVWILLHLLS